MFLSTTLRDKWGLPTVTFDCGWKTNELNMRKDMMNSAAEMLEAAGLKNVTPFDDGSAPGLCIHEMGTARMGRDPKTSVLNGWNQVHTAPNVFVTDGACMTSASCVNPSLTYMALTARAVRPRGERNQEAKPVSSWHERGPAGTGGGRSGRREAIRRAALLAGVALSPSWLSFVGRAQAPAAKTYLTAAQGALAQRRRRAHPAADRYARRRSTSACPRSSIACTASS